MYRILLVWEMWALAWTEFDINSTCNDLSYQLLWSIISIHNKLDKWEVPCARQITNNTNLIYSATSTAKITKKSRSYTMTQSKQVLNLSGLHWLTARRNWSVRRRGLKMLHLTVRLLYLSVGIRRCIALFKDLKCFLNLRRVSSTKSIEYSMLLTANQIT